MTVQVLVVEDDEMIREMIDIVLSQAGYSVSLASSGEAAMDVLKRERFGLVLMDLHMPRMSGLDVLAAMKKTMRPVPPVLMVTADRGEAAVSAAMKLGCVGYLAKPFTPDVLKARVGKILSPPPASPLSSIEI